MGSACSTNSGRHIPSVSTTNVDPQQTNMSAPRSDVERSSVPIEVEGVDQGQGQENAEREASVSRNTNGVNGRFARFSMLNNMFGRRSAPDNNRHNNSMSSNIVVVDSAGNSQHAGGGERARSVSNTSFRAIPVPTQNGEIQFMFIREPSRDNSSRSTGTVARTRTSDSDENSRPTRRQRIAQRIRNPETPSTNSNPTPQIHENAARIAEIREQLRDMEGFFESMIGHAFSGRAGREGGLGGFEFNLGAFGEQDEGPGRNGTPPASQKAMQRVPTIVVSPEDLVDETNRECCICLESNNLGDKVSRLPCGHLFHKSCISEWLCKSCICPMCRLELETDDEQYEVERKRRMADRKPRFHRYELDRMPVRELHALLRRLYLTNSPHFTEKKEIIDYLVSSNKIDLIIGNVEINRPEFFISDLRLMGIGRLKALMGASGVFFDPKDVVEKEDLVMIFINSGRIIVLPEKVTESPITANEQFISQSSTATRAAKRTCDALNLDDCVEEIDGNNNDKKMPAIQECTVLHAGGEIGNISDVNVNLESKEKHMAEEYSNLDSEQNQDRHEALHLNENVEDTSCLGSNVCDNREYTNIDHDTQGMSSNDIQEITANMSDPEMPFASSSSCDAYNPPFTRNTPSDLEMRSISTLRSFAREMGISTGGCLEKSDLVKRIVAETGKH